MRHPLVAHREVQALLSLIEPDEGGLLRRDALAPEQSRDWRGLAVSVLHRLVLDRVLKGAFGGNPSCKYVHRMEEVAAAVAARECQVAVLVPPATMAHVETIAGNLEKMPPKSTYFYPKLLTGLVFNSLKAH